MWTVLTNCSIGGNYIAEFGFWNRFNFASEITCLSLQTRKRRSNIVSVRYGISSVKVPYLAKPDLSSTRLLVFEYVSIVQLTRILLAYLPTENKGFTFGLNSEILDLALFTNLILLKNQTISLRFCRSDCFRDALLCILTIV